MPKAHRLIAGLATTALALSLIACSSGGSNIAAVNGEKISRSDLESKLDASPQAKQILGSLVQGMLVEQYAKDNHLDIAEADVDKKENEIKAQYGAQFDQLLKSKGLTETDVRRLIRQQLIVDRAVGKDIKISDTQVNDFFKKNHTTLDKQPQVRARHILVPDLAKANQVEQQLKNGAKFEDLAKQFSTDPGSKEKGGELGMFKKGSMVPAFEAVAFTIPIGQISKPVKSPFGYHIIQVEERQNGQKATLASARTQIVDQLRQQQEGPLVAPFLSSLQQKAKIEVYDDKYKDAFPSPMPGGASPPAAASSPAK